MTDLRSGWRRTTWSRRSACPSRPRPSPWQLDQLALSVLAVLPALIGMWAGQILRRAVSPAAFRRWFLIMLALLGGEMLQRSVV